VSEQHDFIAALEAAGVLAGIRWAFLSATDRVLDDYSEAAGHDATWLGITRFTLFRDRLDRVFSCGRYVLDQATDGTAGLDILRAELSERDIATLPRLDPDLVERSDLNGSPGWAWQGRRWLLASARFGKIDTLSWPEKSQTKQWVAEQRNLDPDQPSLFDGLADGEVDGLAALATLADGEQQLDRETLVAAHSQDVDHEGRELVLGRARLNAGGGKAWHWRVDLLASPPAGSERHPGGGPAPTGPDDGTPDAPVRLRPPAAESPSQQASGER
jgi:hypothetical protein